jgi:hypothetical protein
MTRIGSLLIAALAVVLASCGGGGPSDLGPVAIYPGSWNGDDASLTGTLQREGSCLYVSREGSSAMSKDTPGYFERYFVAFAAEGTSWNESAQSLRIPGKTLKVGEQIRVGGSEVAANRKIEWVRQPDPSCDVSHIWSVGT